MTGAELKTLREACGLSVAWIAAHAAVQERTARYWEDSNTAVPQDVAKIIRHIDGLLTQSSNQALAQASQLTDTHGAPQLVVLSRYRTDADLWAAHPDMQGMSVTTHAAILQRTRLGLVKMGLAVSIQYLN